MGKLNYDHAPALGVPTRPANDVSNQVASTEFVQNVLPPGVVMPYAGPMPPTGWLLADGSEVSRTQYPRLFAAIGTTYGNGDGTSTFKLPDLRGEFIRGLDNGRGVDAGRALGSGQAATSIHRRPHVGLSNEITINADNAEVGPTQPASAWQAASATAPAQSAAMLAVRPRNVAMNYIIKAQ